MALGNIYVATVSVCSSLRLHFKIRKRDIKALFTGIVISLDPPARMCRSCFRASGIDISQSPCNKLRIEPLKSKRTSIDEPHSQSPKVPSLPKKPPKAVENGITESTETRLGCLFLAFVAVVVVALAGPMGGAHRHSLPNIPSLGGG